MEEGEMSHVWEKKRRLSAEQVKALEKDFEVEKKVEVERKVKLAEELGLQPRQVAVWFQNRRARWKTKQLEADHAALKSTYDALALEFDALRRRNQSLREEICKLKSKLGGDDVEEKTVTETVNGGVTVTENPEDGRKEGEGPSDSDSSAIVNEGSPHQLPPAANGVGLELWEYEPAAEVKMEEHDFFGEEPCSTLLFSDDQPPSLHWYCGGEWN